MKLLESRACVTAPADFACPICGAQLAVIESRAWNQDEDGTWFATEVDIECTTEPDIDADEWEDWHAGHYRTPYIDWLPLEQRILQWMRREFRFNLKD